MLINAYTKGFLVTKQATAAASKVCSRDTLVNFFQGEQAMLPRFVFRRINYVLVSGFAANLNNDICLVGVHDIATSS